MARWFRKKCTPWQVVAAAQEAVTALVSVVACMQFEWWSGQSEGIAVCGWITCKLAWRTSRRKSIDHPRYCLAWLASAWPGDCQLLHDAMAWQLDSLAVAWPGS
jgi:hypothetical protein